MDMPLNIGTWVLAATPIIILLIGILLLKWPTYKIGAVSWIVTVLLGAFVFRADMQNIVLASSKGLSVSIYVLLIVWTAVFLYNVADKAGAISVIGKVMSKVSDNRLTQCLLLAWCFTSLLQGLAGFGVPVAVIAPILVIMGFSPMVAVTTCLVGHSWSISFGSMGSSYNTIQLVTGIPGDVIGPQMAILFIVPIFLTGFATAHIYGGFKAAKKSIPLVLISGTCISAGLYAMTLLGLSQIAGLGAAMCGCIATITYARFTDGKQKASDPSSIVLKEEKREMSFFTACIPYLSLIVISSISQIPTIKTALVNYVWGLNYPALLTGYGYGVEAVNKYSKIQLFSHPAPILLISTIIGYFVYVKKAKASKSIISDALKSTIKKCSPTSIGISTMAMMALVMSDSGMTHLLAQGVAHVFGSYYIIASPFMGVLGTFLTGSNTNSNIMFGVLQYETALAIQKSGVIMAALQSVGGSLGVSISPSSVMMGATNVGLTGQENKIMAKTLVYCLITTLVLGIIVWACTLS